MGGTISINKNSKNNLFGVWRSRTGNGSERLKGWKGARPQPGVQLTLQLFSSLYPFWVLAVSQNL